MHEKRLKSLTKLFMANYSLNSNTLYCGGFFSGYKFSIDLFTECFNIKQIFKNILCSERRSYSSSDQTADLVWNGPSGNDMHRVSRLTLLWMLNAWITEQFLFQHMQNGISLHQHLLQLQFPQDMNVKCVEWPQTLQVMVNSLPSFHLFPKDSSLIMFMMFCRRVSRHLSRSH